MKKIVAIGGGTGLSSLLRGIKDYPFEISVVVTMTDNGRSTGRLRKNLGALPPGDIRNCMAALSKDESKLLDLFQYRFKKGKGLAGHSLGNLLISALEDMTGNFETAIEEISSMLSIKGKIYPSTLEDVYLYVEFKNGKKVILDREIYEYRIKSPLRKVFLSHNAETNKKAIKAINEADIILIGPGSLNTSVVPNFLLDEISKAVKRSNAFRIYICNVSTERGETEGFKLSDHINTLKSYGANFDSVIVNDKCFESGSGDGYVMPVELDLKNISGVKVFTANIVNEENPLYHDSKKLGRLIYEISQNHSKKKKPLAKLIWPRA